MATVCTTVPQVQVRQTVGGLSGILMNQTGQIAGECTCGCPKATYYANTVDPDGTGPPAILCTVFDADYPDNKEGIEWVGRCWKPWEVRAGVRKKACPTQYTKQFNRTNDTGCGPYFYWTANNTCYWDQASANAHYWKAQGLILKRENIVDILAGYLGIYPPTPNCTPTPTCLARGNGNPCYKLGYPTYFNAYAFNRLTVDVHRRTFPTPSAPVNLIPVQAKDRNYFRRSGGTPYIGPTPQSYFLRSANLGTATLDSFFLNQIVAQNLNTTLPTGQWSPASVGPGWMRGTGGAFGVSCPTASSTGPWSIRMSETRGIDFFGNVTVDGVNYKWERGAGW